MRSASEWCQITVAELRAFLVEAYLLAIFGCIGVDYALRHAANVREPYAMSIAFFWVSMTQLPVLSVRRRRQGGRPDSNRYREDHDLGCCRYTTATTLRSGDGRTRTGGRSPDKRALSL